MLGLPDVTESAEGTSGYVKACLDVFMGTIVIPYEASEICALQLFSNDCDKGCCWRIDKHHLTLFLVDVTDQFALLNCLAAWIFPGDGYELPSS